MATVRPFKAVRPRADLASKVAALPYDVMNSDEAREMTAGNPYSFLHVDKAEIDLEMGIDLYDDRVYRQARDNMYKMISDNILKQEDTCCFYIYQLVRDGRSQLGLVACTSIDEYLNNTIKKHELTLEAKEQDRIRHVEACDANTGPIYLTYRGDVHINSIIDGWTKSHPAVYDFVAEDGIGHAVWVVDDEEIINGLVVSFQDIPNLYIADGHHRNASAVKVGLKRREEDTNRRGDAEYNFYLSVIFPAEQLQIMDYNRLVKDLNGLSEEEFFDAIAKSFYVERYTGSGDFAPAEKFTYGMYINKSWFKLTARDGIISKNDPVDSLDVSVLQNHLLEAVLGISDLRTSKRVDFVGGIRGLSELTKRVDSGEMRVAFSMYPTSMEELMNIADNDEIMPPKSTWFEPKLRSGLFIHLLSD